MNIWKDPRWLRTIGLVLNIAGVLFIAGPFAFNYAKSLFDPATKNSLEESAIAQAYNRLGPEDRTVALADPIVQGILSRYWQSFVGICLILLGFLVQLFANWMPAPPLTHNLTDT
jgi:hypothetical protein